MKTVLLQKLFPCLVIGGLAGCASQQSPSAVAAPVQNNSTTITQTIVVKGEKFSPAAFLKEMYAANRRFAFGKHHDCGVWMISRHSVPLKNGRTIQEAAALAEVRAKKQIASFLGSKMTSYDKAYMASYKGDSGTVTTSVLESFSQIDVQQLLRGVTLFQQDVRDGKLTAAYYVTGKLVDAAKELEKQLRSAPPGVVRAVGFGVIVENRIPPAKRSAVQSALRNAVEQVMGTTVIGSSQLMDNDKVKAKVISQTAGKVKQYRIVKEGRSNQNYQVIVNAEVDEKHIWDNYSAIVRSMGNPDFFINTQDPDLRYALNGFLAELGLSVTDDAAKAHFTVNADCRYMAIKDEHYGNGIQIDLGIVLSDVKTNRQLFSMKNVPRLTSSYSGSFHQVRRSAAQKAFRSIKKQIHIKLDRVIMDWVLNGHPVEIVIHNFNGDREVAKKILSAINLVPCAKTDTYLIEGNDLKFNCSYTGPTADLEDFLIERLSRDHSADMQLPKTISISLSKLEMSF